VLVYANQQCDGSELLIQLSASMAPLVNKTYRSLVTVV